MNKSKIIQFLRKLLFPFGIVYGLIIFLRNRAFDWGFLHQTSFNIPIFVVGNITVGGTGKTPVTEYLIDLLYTKYSIGLLSRGYGRKTKGVIYADDTATAQTIGDEPYQIKTKFPKIETCVAEKRVLGVNKLVNTGVDLIICDDAFQHRYLKPTRAIVVIDYNRPLWKDCMLPAGELREYASEINRADVVIVNKCPSDISYATKELFLNKIELANKQNIFFSTYKYGTPINLNDRTQELLSTKKIVAFSGIAQPKPFYHFLENHYSVIDTITFPDHHNFTEVELLDIAIRLQRINEDFAIITTEKDASRLKQFPTFKYSSETWYLPIKIEILFDEAGRFNNLIESYVTESQRNNTFS